MQDSSPSYTKNPTVNAVNTRSILDAVLDGRELSPSDALHLLLQEKKDDLLRLQEAANDLRKQQVGEGVLYTTGCSLFLTNLCEMAPILYPYVKAPGHDHSYTLSIDTLDAQLETARSRQLQQIYISGGGFWPFLQIPGLEAPNILKTYAKLFAYVHEQAPNMTIIGLSPDEIDFLCILADRKERYILEMMQDQGMQILGGNGVEILVDSVRQQVSPRKATVKRWFEIVAAAHKLNIPTMAKLEAGPLETPQQRIAHFEKLRSFIKKHPGAFKQLVPQQWTRSPRELILKLPGLPYSQSIDRLKLTAVMRLFLGHVLPNQQVFWQIGSNQEKSQAEEAQEGLHWGANHFGSTDALAYQAFLSGSHHSEAFTESEFQELITQAERTPQRMDPVNT